MAGGSRRTNERAARRIGGSLAKRNKLTRFAFDMYRFCVDEGQCRVSRLVRFRGKFQIVVNDLSFRKYLALIVRFLFLMHRATRIRFASYFAYGRIGFFTLAVDQLFFPRYGIVVLEFPTSTVEFTRRPRPAIRPVIRETPLPIRSPECRSLIVNLRGNSVGLGEIPLIAAIMDIRT